MAASTLTIWFSCKECGLKQEEVEVRCRTPNESLDDWVKNPVGTALRCSHATKNLLCPNTNFNVFFPSPIVTRSLGEWGSEVPPPPGAKWEPVT